MSRVGKQPIPLPAGVDIIIQGSEVTVKGPKGQLAYSFHPDMSISRNDGQLIVSRPSEDRLHRAMHGLTRALLANMVQGVTQGFHKDLEIVGVGYRAQQSGDKLMIQVGYSRAVEVQPPPGVSVTVEGTSRIIVSGIDKQLVGEIAARIRKVRPPDSYKGKGIRYAGERVRHKPGKAGGRKK